MLEGIAFKACGVYSAVKQNSMVVVRLFYSW